MLVKFKSEVDSLTMFGDVALAILKLMGTPGTVPGALAAEDVPAALDTLRRAVEAGAPVPHPEAREGEDEESKPLVSLRQRAWPVLEMLERAARKRSYVMWEEEKPTFR